MPAASILFGDGSRRSRSRWHSELLVIPFQQSYLWNVIDKNKLKKFHFDDTDTFLPLSLPSTNNQTRKSWSQVARARVTSSNKWITQIGISSTDSRGRESQYAARHKPLVEPVPRALPARLHFSPRASSTVYCDSCGRMIEKRLRYGNLQFRFHETRFVPS